MTLATRETETIASRLRRNGTQVDEPRADNLREELQAMLDRLRAGETLAAELSRRDPDALCAIALTRPLTEIEARIVLGRLRYLEGIIEAVDRSRQREQEWARLQSANAEEWGRECAKLGRRLEQLSGATPPAARPVDANTAAIVRASDELTELRSLARGVASEIGQPGLEQEPETLLARFHEYLASMRGDAGLLGRAAALCTTDDCDGGEFCPWTPYQGLTR